MVIVLVRESAVSVRVFSKGCKGPHRSSSPIILAPAAYSTHSFFFFLRFYLFFEERGKEGEREDEKH